MLTTRRVGRPPAPDPVWLAAAQRLHHNGLPLPLIARQLQQEGHLDGTPQQAYYHVRWRLARAKRCPCGAEKSTGAVLCMACRRERGWRPKDRGPAPVCIDEPTLAWARELYDAGLGLPTVARVILPHTGYATVNSARDSLINQWERRGWRFRSRQEGTALANRRRAGKARSVVAIVAAHPRVLTDEAPIRELTVSRETVRPPNPHVFRERANPGDMSALEYWDANNECRHGLLPHEGCQDCAGTVVELPAREPVRRAA